MFVVWVIRTELLKNVVLGTGSRYFEWQDWTESIRILVQKIASCTEESLEQIRICLRKQAVGVEFQESRQGIKVSWNISPDPSRKGRACSSLLPLTFHPVCFLICFSASSEYWNGVCWLNFYWRSSGKKINFTSDHLPAMTKPFQLLAQTFPRLDCVLLWGFF